jgi:D-serine deaminase-like pyridoxal phosphate-dependent protein
MPIRFPSLDLMEARLADLAGRPLDDFDKGSSALSGVPLADVGTLGLSLPDRQVPLPALALRWEAMLGNVARLQLFCDDHDVLFAPHGKTTMAPQIFHEQLRAGAWAITVATVRQALVAAAYGVPRILVANEPVTPGDFASIAQILKLEPGPDLLVFVDNPDVVSGLTETVRRSGAIRPLSILIEIGASGGRGGIRRTEELNTVLKACAGGIPDVVVSGVGGYEGILRGSDPDDRLTLVDRYLGELGGAARRVRDAFPDADMVSAGGSVFFDRVVELLSPRVFPGFRLVLRSGAYVTHDHGLYDRQSPFGTGRRLGGHRLEAALELWSSVVSRPEPELAILGFGRRDAPTDSGDPVALGIWDDGLRTVDATITGLNDQHAYLRLAPEVRLKPGDSFVSGISHPCTAFDKWRTILTIDDDRNVTGAIRTFF